MNLTLATHLPDNLMANDTNNLTTRNKVWKNEANLSALKSSVQCELSNLHNKIDRFMETFNQAISNIETKPYLKFLQDNIEFLQCELRYKDEIIKTDGNSNRCSGKTTFKQATATDRKQHFI